MKKPLLYGIMMVKDDYGCYAAASRVTSNAYLYHQSAQQIGLE